MVLLISGTVLLYIPVLNYSLPGILFQKKDFNDRFAYLENQYSSVGVNITFERFTSPAVLSNTIQNNINLLNAKNMPGFTNITDVFQPQDIITSAKLNAFFVKTDYSNHFCSTNTSCYAKKSSVSPLVYKNQAFTASGSLLKSIYRNTM